MKKLLSILTVSTQLFACGGAAVDEPPTAADCKVNLPVRQVSTTRATKIYSSPNATSAVVLDLPVGQLPLDAPASGRRARGRSREG
jgi:hypothetical protein